MVGNDANRLWKEANAPRESNTRVGRKVSVTAGRTGTAALFAKGAGYCGCAVIGFCIAAAVKGRVERRDIASWGTTLVAGIAITVVSMLIAQRLETQEAKVVRSSNLRLVKLSVLVVLATAVVMLCVFPSQGKIER